LARASLAASASAAMARWSWTGSLTSLLKWFNTKSGSNLGPIQAWASRMTGQICCDFCFAGRGHLNVLPVRGFRDKLGPLKLH